jgi:hypothetical protein
MKDYDRLRKEAWDFYSKLEPVLCHALNNKKVSFSNAGFRHLFYKGRRRRSPKDVFRRLKILPYAQDVIRSESAGIIFKTGTSANFWEIRSRHKNRPIKVVIRQINGGSIHFFSIMDKFKLKNPSS